MPKNWLIDENKFLSRELDGECIILNLDSGNYYTLGEVGTMIFRYLLKDTPIGQIEEILTGAYEDVNHNVIRRDISAFIRDLKRNKIINVVS